MVDRSALLSTVLCKAVSEKYMVLLSASTDSTRGAEVFARACALCHKAGNLGISVGPALAPLGDKPQDYWIKNILEPNAAIEPRFTAVMIEFTDGDTIAGIITSESATSLTLVQPGGNQGTLLRTEIRKITPARSSLMPNDFEKAISPSEMADLVAFLLSAANR
jgi:putative heme-binding domain-containing protein